MSTSTPADIMICAPWFLKPVSDRPAAAGGAQRRCHFNPSKPDFNDFRGLIDSELPAFPHFKLFEQLLDVLDLDDLPLTLGIPRHLDVPELSLAVAKAGVSG